MRGWVVQGCGGEVGCRWWGLGVGEHGRSHEISQNAHYITVNTRSNRPTYRVGWEGDGAPTHKSGGSGQGFVRDHFNRA